MVQTSGKRGKLACCNIYSVITYIQFNTVRAHTMERQPALSVKQRFKTQILKRLLLRQLLLEGETCAETI